MSFSNLSQQDLSEKWRDVDDSCYILHSVCVPKVKKQKTETQKRRERRRARRKKEKSKNIVYEDWSDIEDNIQYKK
jgi:hypothetical protein